MGAERVTPADSIFAWAFELDRNNSAVEKVLVMILEKTLGVKQLWASFSLSLLSLCFTEALLPSVRLATLDSKLF